MLYCSSSKKKRQVVPLFLTERLTLQPEQNYLIYSAQQERACVYFRLVDLNWKDFIKNLRTIKLINNQQIYS